MMIKYLINILLILAFPYLIWAQNQDEPKVSQLSLVFAGDIMGHDSQIASALDSETGEYYYDTCFSLIKPFIEDADIALANLEVTLAGSPYTGYPQFSSPDPLAKAARDAGFDIFITANNHALDRGKKGLERTLNVLDTLGVVHTGTFNNQKNKDIHYPLIVEKNNIRLAILNYTYGTNGLKVQAPNIVNYIDTAQIRSDLEKAGLAEPDFTIVTIHWGLEYQRTENEVQKQLAGFIYEHGADAIIGSHPHVVQPIRISYPVETDSSDFYISVYSLGNFISNQRKRFTDGGIIFRMKLEKTDSVRVKDFSYLPVWVYKPKKSPEGNHFVLVPANTDDEYYTELGMPDEDRSIMNTFYKDTKCNLTGIPEAMIK
jgi:poly-gamma-glutamate capsule biosynthesis protein CapA/YwtB (metallophosphatase superfamily)